MNTVIHTGNCMGNYSKNWVDNSIHTSRSEVRALLLVTDFFNFLLVRSHTQYFFLLVVISHGIHHDGT